MTITMTKTMTKEQKPCRGSVGQMACSHLTITKTKKDDYNNSSNETNKDKTTEPCTGSKQGRLKNFTPEVLGEGAK